ncbi:MAG: hypothetical protein AB7P50_22495 [Alphaproteobacteria bacterium]
MQRADAKRFAAKCATVQDVSKEDVQWWTTAALIHDGLTPERVQRIVSALRGYWRYLQSLDAWRSC